MKRIVIMGSTGSVGTQALDIIRHHRDKFKIVGLTTHQNTDKLHEQIAEFNPEAVCIADEEKAESFHTHVQLFKGNEGLKEIAVLDYDLLINAVVAIGAWRSSNVKFDWSGVSAASLKALVIAGLPLAGTAVVLRLRGDAEVMLLGLGLSVQVLGWWSAAERISYIALFVPTLLMTPLMPALSSVATDAAAFRNTLRRSLDLTVVLTLGASCGVVAIAPAVPDAFGWGPDFVAAIPLIELISVVTPIVSAGMILGTALIALGDERRWFVMSIVASSLHLIFTPAAIYIFNTTTGNGAIGAAIAKLLVEMLMIAGAIYLLPRGSVSRSSWVVLAKAIVASGAMIAVVRVILVWDSWLALPAGIVSGGLVFVIVLAALRILPPSEFAEVSGFIRATIRRKSG